MGIAFGVSAYYNAEVFVTLGVYGVLMVMVVLMRASPQSIWEMPVVRAARACPVGVGAGRRGVPVLLRSVVHGLLHQLRGLHGRFH